MFFLFFLLLSKVKERTVFSLVLWLLLVSCSSFSANSLQAFVVSFVLPLGRLALLPCARYRQGWTFPCLFSCPYLAVSA
jgi:hypothetical protein